MRWRSLAWSLRTMSRKSNLAPGWWIIPGALLGGILWVLVACAANVILSDSGGLLRDYAARVEAGPPAEIMGTCASACTMWLANGCVHPGAVLVFHPPSYASGAPMPDDRQAHWAGFMAEYYPPAIASWYMSEGRHGVHRMSGAQAIEMGAVPC